MHGWGSKRIRAIASLALLVFLVGTLGTTAYPGETAAGDGNRDSRGCHTDGGPASLTVTASADAEPGETDYLIQVTVDLQGAQDSDSPASQLFGVMLLSDSGKVQDAGFTLTQDPKGNVPAFNYNEFTWDGTPAVLGWRATVPDQVGNYTFFARLMYDDSGPTFLESEPVTLSVAVPVQPPDTNGPDDGTNATGPAPAPAVGWNALLAGVIVGGLSVVAVEILRRRND